jgi:ribosomal protein S18 acetylase RimI-like enzyme
MDTRPLAFMPPNHNLIIRPVRLVDCPALHRRCWPQRDLADVQQQIQRVLDNTRQGRGGGVVAVPPDDEQPIAYGQLTLWRHLSEISDLIVTESRRDQGVGTAIIQHLVAQAAQTTLPLVEIGVAQDNPDALRLYRRLGFREARALELDLGRGPQMVIYLELRLR